MGPFGVAADALWISVLCGLVWMSTAYNIPAVQVYSREPAVVGVNNSLICYLNNFQPPEVQVELLKNGAVIPGGVQSDLMFEQKWQYHLTKTVSIVIQEGDRYACRITHVGRTTTHHWNMDE